MILGEREQSYLNSGGTLVNGSIPVLNANYTKPNVSATTTPIVNSNIAKDHIANMGSTIDQAKKDIETASTYRTNLDTQNKVNEQVQQQQKQEMAKADPLAALISSLGNDQQDTVTANKKANEIDKGYLQQVSSAIDQMNAGTYPLTTSEKAAVDNLRLQATSVFEQAQRLTEKQKMGQTALNARSGLQMYSPTEAVSRIAKVIEEGNNRVGEINTRLIQNQSALEQAFKDKDFKTATSLYNKISDTIKERNDEIKTINDEVKDRRKELMDYIKDERDREEKAQAEVTKNKNEILQKLGVNQAPRDVIEAVGNAQTVEEAVALAGDYLHSENDKLDAMYKRAQIDKVYNDIKLDNEKKKDELKQDPAQIVAYASEYASTGKIPTGMPKGTFGQVAQYAKELPKTPGQVISVSTGVSPSDNATLQTGLGSLYSAVELAKQLKQLDEERWSGVLSGTFGKLTGSDAQTKYLDLRSQIVDLIARARSGAALTPSEEARYSDMLPGRFSESFGLGADSQVKIDNFINALTTDAKNKASSQGWAINGLSDVDVAGQKYKVGDVITNASGENGRVNADGSITLLQ